MSYDIGIRTCRREATPRLAHTEYCSSDPLVRAFTGRDPRTDPGAWRAFHDAWELDLLWISHDGPVPWAARGRATDMGHAVFLEGGTDRREPQTCPFTSVEEVWAFDAVAEYGLPDTAELVAFYEDFYRRGQAANPEQVYPGGYYKTIISGAIEAFGWEMLLLAAADPDRFEPVLDSIFRLTMHHVEAWAKTSIEVFIQHDDFVWTAGPFMRPDFYRQAIIPRFAELWKVLHAAGKIVLFCSDGDFTVFVDDLAAAGADGFIFEPLTNLEYIVERYGQSHVIVGSKVDCRTLTFGTPQQIQAEVDATLALAHGCPGFICAVGNHIPSNVPEANARAYLDYLTRGWRREPGPLAGLETRR